MLSFKVYVKVHYCPLHACLFSFVNVDGIKTSIRLHNLKKYTTYFVWLSARTSVGAGPTSNKHTFSTAEDGEFISCFPTALILFRHIFKYFVFASDFRVTASCK